MVYLESSVLGINGSSWCNYGKQWIVSVLPLIMFFNPVYILLISVATLNWEKEALNSLNINVICGADKNQAIPLQQAGLIQVVACLLECAAVCAHRLCHECLLLARVLCLFTEQCFYMLVWSPGLSLVAGSNWHQVKLACQVLAFMPIRCSCASDGFLLLCY